MSVKPDLTINSGFTGILSAYGMGLADVVAELQEPSAKYLVEANMADVISRGAALTV